MKAEVERGTKLSNEKLRKNDTQQAANLRRINNLERLVKDVDMKHRDMCAQRAHAHQEQVKEIVANNCRLVEKMNKSYERRNRHLTITSESLAQANAEHAQMKKELAHSHVSQLRVAQQMHDRQLAKICAQCEYILEEKRREMKTFVADCNNYRKIVSQKVNVRCKVVVVSVLQQVVEV